MRHEATLGNGNLIIRLSTNDAKLLELVQRQLDFQDLLCGPFTLEIKLELMLCDPIAADQAEDIAFWHRDVAEQQTAFLNTFFGTNAAAISTDFQKAAIKAKIFQYEERYKERLYDFVVTRPLVYILAHHGLYFVHAAGLRLPSNESPHGNGPYGNTVLISGPQHCGKSAISLSLDKAGHALIADDDCFIAINQQNVSVYSLPTKIGLKPSHYQLAPELEGIADRNYFFGGKQRISANRINTNTNLISGESRCRAIIFPKYDLNQGLKIEPLPQKEALQLLITDSFRQFPTGYSELAAKTALTFYEFSKLIPAYKLTYNDHVIREIPQALQELLHDRS